MRKAVFAQTLARLLIVASVLGLGACSWFQFPGVYKLTIQQGNIVTPDMLEQLQPGMTKRQVNFVLGTPLIVDSFHQDRWDYFYSLRNSEGETTTQHLTVYFDGDRMTHYQGDITDLSAIPEAEEIHPEAEGESLSKELLPEDGSNPL